MRPLSAALLSWEYPPVVVGGLSRHVYELARHLALEGHRVTVYTRGHVDAPGEEDDEGVRVVRVSGYPPPLAIEDLVPWTLAFNIALIHRALPDLLADPPDVLHAHDWLVAYAGAVLKDVCSVPLVATIHATEHGRHGGSLPGPTQRFVHRVERWLVSEADRVIACSAFMRHEVADALAAPTDRLDLVPNEVDLAAFERPAPSVRDSLWPADRPLVLFAGRLEYEKGLQTAVEALAEIDRASPGVGLLVAGDGTYRSVLEEQVARLGLRHRVLFEGFVGEERLRSLYRSADVAIVPSVYEPFGLVALEAMASGIPVVVADTGGLREIVDHDVSGLRFPPGDAAALARSVLRMLRDDDLRARIVAGARKALEARGSWSTAAIGTAETYRRAVEVRRDALPLRVVRDG